MEKKRARRHLTTKISELTNVSRGLSTELKNILRADGFSKLYKLTDVGTRISC